ncbi:MAG: YerC/YecD family TrpR-related protein [Erysipelotrichaceae bacterium]|nr:YerC/YecD family TrpR-related protein [Erysipelotrichaceae bacterium]
MNAKDNREMIKDLYQILVSLENEKDAKNLLDDLCTNKEVEQMAQRIRAARLLMEGKTYNQVIEETEISSATLSRVSRCVKYGKGYNKMLK